MESYVSVRESESGLRCDGQARCVLGRLTAPAHPGGLPQGIFAEWDWDGQRLVVRNDRYGFFPLYDFQTKREIMVSDSITSLIELGAPADLDEDAHSVYLRAQTFL